LPRNVNLIRVPAFNYLHLNYWHCRVRCEISYADRRGYKHPLTETLTRKLNENKAWIFISEVKNLRRTKMSAVFGSYDGQLENTSSMSDVADVFRTHWSDFITAISIAALAMYIVLHSNKLPTPPFSIWHCRVNRSCKGMKFHFNVLWLSVFKMLLKILKFKKLRRHYDVTCDFVPTLAFAGLKCTKIGCKWLRVLGWMEKNTKNYQQDGLHNAQLEFINVANSK